MAKNRIVLMVGLLVLSVGPAPGEVGGCGDADVIADAEDHCRLSRYWDCRRQEARMEIENVQACVDDVEAMCAGAAWPASCEPFPLRRQSQACIDQLALIENVFHDPNGDGNYEIREIAECNLCGGGS